MKKSLLLSTALVLALGATQSHALVISSDKSGLIEPELTNSDIPQPSIDVKDKAVLDSVWNATSESDESSEDVKILWVDSVNVAKGGTLDIINSNIIADKDENGGDLVIINGNLKLTKSILEAGNDSDEVSDNVNMVLNGANVNMKQSDLEANGNLTIRNSEIVSVNAADTEKTGLWADKDVSIENSTANLQNSYIASQEKMQIKGANLSLNNSMLESWRGDLTIDGNTTINAKDSFITGSGIEVNGGSIVLENSNFTSDEHDNDISFKLNNGTITINGTEKSSYIGGNEQPIGDYDGRAGKFEISGGQLVVNGNGAIEGKEITVSGGVIDVNKNAKLRTISQVKYDKTENEDENREPVKEYVSVINLKDKGVINLSSTLESDVSGNGTINIKDSAAVVRGNIDGSNLNIYADHSLSRAITGAVGDLAALNVNGGTFELDKKTGTIGSLNVAENAVLNAKGAYSYQENEDNDGVLYVGNLTVDKNGTINVVSSDITATNENGNVVEIYGNVDLNRANISAGDDLEHWDATKPENKQNMLLDGANVTYHTNEDLLSAMGDLTVKNTTLIAKDSADDYNENDKYQGGGLYALGDINIENSKLDMKDLYISVGFDDNLKGDGDINIANSEIAAGFENYNGDIIVNNSNITSEDIFVYQGDFTLNGGNITIKTEGGDGLGAKNITINDGTVNMASSKEFGKDDVHFGGYDSTVLNNSTLNIQDTITLNGNTDVKGSTINIAENSALIYEKSEPVINFDKNSVLNLAGTMGIDTVNSGTINILNSAAKFTGNAAMDNGGVLNVGLNKVTIEGDALFNSGSTLKIEVADSGNGMLSANKITSADGSKLALTINKNMQKGDSSDVTLLEGEVDNNFATEISNSRYEVKRNQDGKSYNITYVANASDVVDDNSGSDTNKSAAAAWDSMASLDNASDTAKEVAKSLNDLSQNNPQKYVEALIAVAPEVAPLVQKTSSEITNQVFNAVSSRLSGGSVGSAARGLSSGDTNAGAAIWAQGLYNKSKLSDTSKAKGFDADSTGAAMGFEKYIGGSKLGFGYAYTSTSIDGFMRDTDIDTHTAMIYGEYKPNNWYVNAVVSYGWSSYSEKKNVAGTEVTADYDVDTLGIQAMTGYDIKLVNRSVLTPEAGLRYIHISQDDYKDSAEQKISTKDSDIVTGVIGAKFTKLYRLLNGWFMRPEARVAATYDLNSNKTDSAVTLANGSAYTVNGTSLERFGVEVGAGVTFDVTDSAEFSLGYEGKFRKDYQDHSGMLSAKYKF